MRAVLTGFICFLFCSSFIGQTEYRSKEEYPFIFFNHQRNKFTVIDDSTGCREYNKKTGSWDLRPLTFELEEPFHRFLEIYTLLHEKGSEIFFVDKGCGMVYTLQNDTVKRHDRTRHHANQFDGTFFLYNGEPHIFGGYGWFQFKNIITRYDILDKEWYAYDVQGIAPDPRTHAFGSVEKQNLYIVGGFSGENSSRKMYKDVWMFDFDELRWKRLGELNMFKNYKLLFSSMITVVPKDNILLADYFFYQFDFSRRTREIYNLFQKGKVYGLLVVGSKCLVHKVAFDDHKALISVVDKTVVFSKKLHSGPLLQRIEEESYIEVMIWTLIGLAIFGGVNYFFFIYRKRGRKDLTKSISINERALLDMFLINGSNGIEISAVNDLVSHDAPSADTLKKRRENLLKELRQKLAGSFRLPPVEVFIEEKHPTDKRIKILKLHQKIADKLQDSNRGK
jgi:hypothetical protein